MYCRGTQGHQGILLLIQCGFLDDTTGVDGVNVQDDETKERLVHVFVGQMSCFNITAVLIQLRTLEVVSPRRVDRLITKVQWDSHILIGEGMVDCWLGHVLQVPVKGVGVALRLGIWSKLPFYLLDGGVAWFPYNRHKVLIGEAILDVDKGWGRQDHHD